MKLLLNREPSTDKCTLGHLYIDGVFECHTLEDIERETKIYGKTAIPPGVYTIIVSRSNRFGVDMPLLLGVGGFSGIRIHPGNTAENTEGCILVGESRGLDRVNNSRPAYDRLFAKIKKAFDSGKQITIEIRSSNV